MVMQPRMDGAYQRARARARRRPVFLLRRWEQRIVKTPRPSNEELAELAAVRLELRIRSIRRSRR